MSESHLYNIRLLKSYIEYIEKYYPDIDILSMLSYAGIAEYELEDAGYWYTQTQADRFHEIVIQKTGNHRIPREAGRLLATSQAHATIRRYLVGFVTPAAIYTSAAFTSPKFTRGGIMESRKLGRKKCEIISRPMPKVLEKAYQCENRMGILEAVPMIFAGRIPVIEHPECLHKGDKHCRYIITWDEPLSFKLKRLRNYFSAVIFIVCTIVPFFLPWIDLIYLLMSALIAFLSFTIISEYQKNKELSKNITEQSNTAEELLEEINTRYNNALLVQETGQAISSILNIKELLESVMQTLQRRTDFDRGIVMLANQDRTRLVFMAGYGYDPEKEGILSKTEFNLDNPKSKGVFVKTFRDKNPYLVSDINKIANELSKKSNDFANLLGTNSFISVPIIFKEEPLGVLAIDNIQTKRQLTKSDMNLLSGIAQQIGISINNARSFSQLQASEEKYRELVQHANSIIMRIDTEGRIVFFNEFAQNFFGYKEEELLGRNIIGTILHSDYQNESKMKAMLKGIEKEPLRYVNIQTENVIKNSERAWIAWTNKSILDGSGRLSEILCVGNDITGIRKVEEKIEHLNELLLTIRNIDNLITHEKERDRLMSSICDKLILTRGHCSAWILLFDEKGKFSRAFESGFKGDFREFLEKIKDGTSLPCTGIALLQESPFIINEPGPVCRDCGYSNRYTNTGRMIARLEYNNKIYGIMSVEIEKDFIEAEEESLLLKEVADEIAFALYSIALEEERKSLQEQLFQSAKLSAVGQLASGVAHEFNNILSGILGHAQLSMMEDSVSSIKESLEDIERAVRRGSGLVRRLSEFAKPREPEFEIQDIKEVIEEIVKLQKKQIQVENIEVIIEPGIYRHVRFDRGQMGQVFLNLLINAVHAIKPRGKGKITISIKDTDKYQEIRFSDTGTGMSAETMKKIFDPFFSTKGAWAKDNLGITGTGLGLSVSHAIIKQHNGLITVESEEGEGTTFIIKLPMPEVKDIKLIKWKTESHDLNNVKTRDLKIMVIDDEEEMISLMKLIFNKIGFRNYLTEKSSIHAIETFQKFNPDVVFLDLLMPGLNGEQVLEKIKSINSAVPVVFMSGKLDLEEHEYKNKGAFDFIKKPFNVNNIFDVLDKVAEQKR